MILRILSGFALVTFSTAVLAQADSFETKKVVLKEILIQNGQSANGTLQRQQGNTQKSTEKILGTISGVSLINRGNFAMEPSLRGLNAGQIALTIDGMAIFGACTDRMDPISSYIEPNNLQSIEIKYGANEEFDGNSIGGGFNFKLKQPRVNAVKKFSGIVGAGYQTNGNAIQTLASVNYSTQKFGVLVNGIFRNSQNYTAAKGEEIRFSQYTKWNGGVGLKYVLKEKSYVLFNYLQDEGYDIGYPALTMDVEFAKAKIGAASYVYHSDAGALKHFEGKVYYNVIHHAMDDTKRPAQEVFIHMDMPGTSFAAGALADARWTFKNHDVKTKVSGYRNRLHAEMTMYPPNGAPMFMLTLPDGERNVVAFQASDRLHLTQSFSLAAGAGINAVSSHIYSEEGKKLISGVLGDKLKRNRLLFNGYLQPQIQLNSQFSIFGNVSLTSRDATLQELYGFYLFNRPDGYDYLGNPGLKSEVSLNFVTGFAHRNEKFKADGQLFRYGIQNYITGLKKEGYSVMTYGANGVKQYENISGAQMMGFEADFSYKISERISTALKNSFVCGRDADGDALPYIPPFRSVHQVKYNFAFGYLLIEGDFASTQKRMSFEKYGETETPAYYVVNFHAGHDFKWNDKKILLSAGVENLLDARYYTHLDILKVPQMGRNLVMKIMISF